MRRVVLDCRAAAVRCCGASRPLRDAQRPAGGRWRGDTRPGRAGSIERSGAGVVRSGQRARSPDSRSALATVASPKLSTWPGRAGTMVQLAAHLTRGARPLHSTVAPFGCGGSATRTSPPSRPTDYLPLSSSPPPFGAPVQSVRSLSAVPLTSHASGASGPVPPRSRGACARAPSAAAARRREPGDAGDKQSGHAPQGRAIVARSSAAPNVRDPLRPGSAGRYETKNQEGAGDLPHRPAPQAPVGSCCAAAPLKRARSRLKDRSPPHTTALPVAIAAAHACAWPCPMLWTPRQEKRSPPRGCSSD